MTRVAGERVLVVDDEPSILAACRRALTHAGYDAQAVGSGTEALARLAMGGVDLLLTDIKMPGMDGLELLRRSRELNPDLAAVALTGYGTLDVAVQAIKLGVSGFVVKPFTVDELTAAVDDALQRTRLIQREDLNDLLQAQRTAEEQHLRLAREQAARAEAEATLRLRDEFVASASHDLKAPLTAVRAYAQLLQRYAAQVRGQGVPRLTDGLTKIETIAGRAIEQLDDMVDIAHVQAGRPIQLRRWRVDLVPLTRQKVAEHQLMNAQHSVALSVGAARVEGNWDKPRIERVLDNLLSNAVKYSPVGGEVSVSVTRETDDQGAEWAVVSVADRGVGIPASDLPHIFEHFHRGANVATQIGGAGLGLASVRTIVEAHGGRISAGSRDGGGTVFTLWLPL